jgi:hypothetical protein
MELTNFLEKNQKLQIQIQVVKLKITPYRTMSISLLKNILLKYPAFQPLGSFSYMAASRSSSKITRKMNLIQ